jgi:hypothetical protein
MMDLERLDQFSKVFAQRLFSEYPDWIEFAKFGNASGADLDYLVVEVPSPASADLARPLLIYTVGGEVSVGFDYYHAHYFDQTMFPANSDVFAFIAKILSEEIAIGSGWDRDIWRGSWPIERGEDPIFTTPLHPMTRIRVRSWRGNFDQDFAVP